MGIPAYFAKTIRSYRKIIKDVEKHPDFLYMDANSIIYQVYYDVLGKLEQQIQSTTSIEDALYQGVFLEIKQYIETIKPSSMVYIAFDGVAPFAKMKQQRTRRFKSSYLRHLNNKQELWNTTNITVGTCFMNALKENLEKQFKATTMYSSLNIIIDSSDEEGEGEQKIMKHIRSLDSKKKIYIYGLDADLIILALRHIEYQPQLYLVREMYKGKKLTCVDIPLLRLFILKTMTEEKDVSVIRNANEIIQDYVCLSFFLGNDFMPHFPSLCIRSNGIDILMRCYKKVIYSRKRTLCSHEQIQWNMMKALIKELAKNEEYYIRKETHERNEKSCDRFPLLQYRQEEHIIDVHTSGWESRYYQYLFHSKADESFIQNVCTNYIEGLQWNYYYYFKDDCPSPTWYYKYNYPPLLSDLLEHMPDFQTNMLASYTSQDESYLQLTKGQRSSVQLHYVLPKSCYSSIPESYRKEDVCYEDGQKDDPCSFIWAYCTYFWESHLLHDAPIQKWIHVQEDS